MFRVVDSNYKGRLLEITTEYCGLVKPEYFHFEYGPHQAKVFLCICIFQQHTCSSEGRTKIEAEQNASQLMLDKIQPYFIQGKAEVWRFLPQEKVTPLSDKIVQLLGDFKTDIQFDVLSLYGDALLRYFIVYYLYKQYPQFREDILTRITDEALKDDTRAEVAKRLALEIYVRTEPTTRVLAQTLSATLGKIAFVANQTAAKKLIMEHYRYFIDTSVTKILESKSDTGNFIAVSTIKTTIHNFKNELLEYAQKYRLDEPEYHLILKDGPSHDPSFMVRCDFGEYIGFGNGKTKKSAEQEASKDILTAIHGGDASKVRSIKQSSSYNHSASRCKTFEPAELITLKNKIYCPHFENVDDLIATFTHPSRNSELNYQRLEFLGDAIVKKVLIRYILKKYPNLVEKEKLAAGLNSLVSANTQAKIAQQLDLAQHIYTQAPCTSNVLSDVLEALIASIFLDDETIPPSTKTNNPNLVIPFWFKKDIELIFGALVKKQPQFFQSNLSQPKREEKQVSNPCPPQLNSSQQKKEEKQVSNSCPPQLNSSQPKKEEEQVSNSCLPQLNSSQPKKEEEQVSNSCPPQLNSSQPQKEEEQVSNSCPPQLDSSQPKKEEKQVSNPCPPQLNSSQPKKEEEQVSNPCPPQLNSSQPQKEEEQVSNSWPPQLNSSQPKREEKQVSNSWSQLFSQPNSSQPKKEEKQISKSWPQLQKPKVDVIFIKKWGSKPPKLKGLNGDERIKKSIEWIFERK